MSTKWLVSFVACFGFCSVAVAQVQVIRSPDDLIVPFCYPEKAHDLSYVPAVFLKVIQESAKTDTPLPAAVRVRLELDDSNTPVRTTVENDGGLAAFGKLAERIAKSSPVRCSHGRVPRILVSNFYFSEQLSAQGEAVLAATQTIRPLRVPLGSSRDTYAECRYLKADLNGINQMDCSYIGACFSKRIAHPQYPRAAINASSEGSASIRVDLDKSDKPMSSTVHRSTGSKPLDIEAQKAAMESKFECIGRNPDRSVYVTFRFNISDSLANINNIP